jgi:HSP20 family protein
MVLRTDFDRLTARVLETGNRTTGARLDAYREGDVFYVDIDLPGVDPAGIDVTVDRRVLTVRAERSRATGENVRRIVTERPTGVVTRQLFLAESLDTDRLEAGYDNGVLTLSIPVTEKAKPRKVEVTTHGRELAAA